MCTPKAQSCLRRSAVAAVPVSPSRGVGLLSDQRGNVFSEYVIVLGTVVLAVGLAIYALGVPLTRSFYLAKLFILLPIP